MALHQWRPGSFAFAVVLALASPAAAQQQARPDQRLNVLTMAAGTLVLSHTGEYSEKWSALNLIDGDPKTGWSSRENAPFPATFVLELPQAYQLHAMAFDNSTTDEQQYPGISSRLVEVWISKDGPDTGYVKVAALETPKKARKEFALPSGPSGQWLKLVVQSNWGNKQYTELMEVEAFGNATGAAPGRVAMTGAYNTNYGRLDIFLDGNAVTGCYNRKGTVAGTSDGRVLNAEWRTIADPASHGGTLMALSSLGNFLNGVWYSNGQYQGEWYGTRIPNEKPNCTWATANTLSANVAKTGRAILYGIRFRSDSAELDPESGTTLTEVGALLREKASLRLVVEGHTDSTNADAYNQDLSTRRANAVVAWLVGHGVEASRLKAVGYGRTKPVADNATPQGRALNRRVEIAVQ
jgi:outer membrane protein OmpA-like peptidoglycan-associated protein